MNHYVLVMDSDDNVGGPYGPGSWDNCITKGEAIIKEQLKGLDPKFIDRAIKFWNGQEVENLGAGTEGEVDFRTIGAGLGGGVYIIQAEPL